MIHVRNCLKCDKETSNPKFCCRSCAAIYNNTLYPKRKPESLCISCGKPNSKCRSYCIDCWKERAIKDSWENLTYKTLGETQSLRRYQKNSRIRAWARLFYKKSGKPTYCVRCGYDKHYEVCHIKPVNSFHEDTLISKINHLDNLIALCPNCHWEFDKGLWKL